MSARHGQTMDTNTPRSTPEPITQAAGTWDKLKPVSMETLTRAMQEIDLLPKPDQWIVIDPHGRMYKGTVEQMTRPLVQEHPLMRTPFELTGANHTG